MSAARPLRTLLVMLLAAAAFCPNVPASTWELDPAATQVAFSVRNLSMANVDGHFRLTSGQVTAHAGAGRGALGVALTGSMPTAPVAAAALPPYTFRQGELMPKLKPPVVTSASFRAR